MNKTIKKIIVLSTLVCMLAIGTWYYTSSSRVPIYDFDFARDSDAVLTMFKEDWYWLDASYDQYTADPIIYKFKNRTPYINPLYTGTMRIKVIREQDQCVAFITYHKEGADSGRILYLEVNNEFRKRGYGKLLAKYALDDLVSLGAKKIRLVTRTDNEASQGLYKRLGFVETSRHEGFVNFEYVVK